MGFSLTKPQERNKLTAFTDEHRVVNSTRFLLDPRLSLRGQRTLCRTTFRTTVENIPEKDTGSREKIVHV